MLKIFFFYYLFQIFKFLKIIKYKNYNFDKNTIKKIKNNIFANFKKWDM